MEQSELDQKTLSWLLEPDPDNPGVRYFALVDLLDCPADDPEVTAARRSVMESGPVPATLAAQDPQGYWIEPGPGYGSKYRGTSWSVIFLAQFGADGADPRVRAGCDYVLDHSRSVFGGFSMDGRPSGMIHCLEGNLCTALIDLGWLGDPRFQSALEWLARSITGQGIAPAGDKAAAQAGIARYYRSGNSGPGFLCSANNHKPCAWGAVKAVKALGRVPEPDRTPAVRAAIQTGVDFLLNCDPATAAYPTAYDTKPSQSWFHFGYPLGYVTDMLQILEALAGLVPGSDPRLAQAYDLLMRKRADQGRWNMDYTYNGKTWADIEKKGQPSKWVTLRALRAIKRRQVDRHFMTTL